MHLSKLLTLLAAATSVSAGTVPWHRKTCVVPASGTNTTDDAPAIIKAFKRCGRRGKVVFKPTTYYVNSVMDIRWLDDVEIDFRGNLLVRLSPFTISKTETYQKDLTCYM
jgi:hypothetical protein